MKKIQSILVANRGEIASRIFRTCRKMGIQSAAIYALADGKSPFVKEADQAFALGSNELTLSYLNQEKIIGLAIENNIDAIHPGYGFLSENDSFADRCARNNIIFIGPHSEAIRTMGSKSSAKELVQNHKIPVVPGFLISNQSIENIKHECRSLGFPVLVKAVAGGGGKGMRIIQNEADLLNGITSAKGEALNAFGDDEILIEKYIENGKHIEVQILGDQHGNTIHLYDRECSIQRNYQKIVEESPAFGISDIVRAKMTEAAIKTSSAINYNSLGTVEFIYDEEGDSYYFLEMNTRIQVEHPVTEQITGLDLVELQIEVAKGLPLSIKQNEVKVNGHAIEVRLNAKDPNREFVPSHGKIHTLEFPKIKGLRVESGIESGSEISVYFDSLIAKLITWGHNRKSAIEKMEFALNQTVCLGINTNLSSLSQIIKNDQFLSGKYHTNFLNNFELADIIDVQKIHECLVVCTLYVWHHRNNTRSLLKALPSGWRNNFYAFQTERFKYKEESFLVQYKFSSDHLFLKLGEKEYQSKIVHIVDCQYRIEINGTQKSYHIKQDGDHLFIHNFGLGNIALERISRFPKLEKKSIIGSYVAPMPCKIIRIYVEVGDYVESNSPLMVISSMKMETTIYASESGIVNELNVEEGSVVDAKYLLLKINPEQK